jgi:hypothetical protein
MITKNLITDIINFAQGKGTKTFNDIADETTYTVKSVWLVLTDCGFSDVEKKYHP